MASYGEVVLLLFGRPDFPAGSSELIAAVAETLGKRGTK
jgi:hypothetical protein